MTKREVRTFLSEFVKRPRKRTDVIAWLWGRALIVAADVLLWSVGFATQQSGQMILVHILLFVGFVYIYQFIAKGR